MFAVPFLFFGVFLAVIVVIALAGHAQAGARRERFAVFAAERGWHYSAATERGLEDRYPELDLFRRGSNRYGRNFLTGSAAGHALTAFDYHYQTSSGSGKNRSTQHHRFTLVMLQPDFPLKPLAIRSEHVFDRLTAAFGWDDIDFESAEFSGKYHVSSPDRRWAFDVITARTMAFLLDREAGSMQMDHVRLMLSLRQVSDPSEILPASDTAAGLLDGIPDYARITPPSLLPPPLP